MFPTIILKAEESVKQALDAAIAHASAKEKKSFIIGFDCSWSHSRNAGQANGEFIYLDNTSKEYMPCSDFTRLMLLNSSFVRNSIL